MKTSIERQNPDPSVLRIMPKAAKKKKKKTPSGNVLNIRVDLDSRKFDGPLRDKVRRLVREEAIKMFSIICSRCNRRSNHDGEKHTSLFMIGSPELTERQREIMELVVQEKSDRYIARQLGIEINTVRNHMKSIKTRLSVHSRTDAKNEYKRLKQEETETGS